MQVFAVFRRKDILFSGQKLSQALLWVVPIKYLINVFT